MKLQTLAVLVTLISIPTFAQTLPDEINHQPYMDRLVSIQGQIRVTQTQISNLNSDIAETRRFIQESQSFISQTNETKAIFFHMLYLFFKENTCVYATIA